MVRREVLAEGVEVYCGRLATSVMEPSMVGASHHLKVFDPVVGLVAVDVVDDFICAQRSAKLHLHQHPMLSLASQCPPDLGRKRDITIPIVRLSALEKLVFRTVSGCGFSLQTATAVSDVLSKGPLCDRLFSAAVTLASPVMKATALFCIGDCNQAPKAMPRQVGDCVGAASFIVGH